MSEERIFSVGFDRAPLTFEDLVNFIRKEKTVEYEKKFYPPELHEELFHLLKSKLGDELMFSFGRDPFRKEIKRGHKFFLLNPEVLEKGAYYVREDGLLGIEAL